MAYEVKQNDQGQDFIVFQDGDTWRGFLADESSPDFRAWCETKDGQDYLAKAKAK